MYIRKETTPEITYKFNTILELTMFENAVECMLEIQRRTETDEVHAAIDALLLSLGFIFPDNEYFELRPMNELEEE